MYVNVSERPTKKAEVNDNTAVTWYASQYTRSRGSSYQQLTTPTRLARFQMNFLEIDPLNFLFCSDWHAILGTKLRLTFVVTWKLVYEYNVMYLGHWILRDSVGEAEQSIVETVGIVFLASDSKIYFCL